MVLFFLILLGAAFLVTQNSLDPDFGWHIKTGELMLERGIPYQDWYSYTMPTFPWINHEWLTDIGMYLVYNQFGQQTLLLLALFIFTCSFFLVRKPEQFLDFAFPVALGYLALMSFLGIRPQILTVFFVALLWRLTTDFLERDSKVFYLVPLIIFAWTNLHASFMAGLIVLTGFLLLELFKHAAKQVKYFKFLQYFYIKEQPAKKIFILAAVLLVSFLATFINPYGISIYEEVFRTTNDNFLRAHIIEWFPLVLSDFMPFLYIYLAVFISFLLILHRKIEINNIVFSLFFFLLSLLSVRYILLFVIVTIPTFIEIFSQLRKQIDVKSFAVISLRDKSLLGVLATVVMFIFILGLFQFSVSSIDAQFYPAQAVSFIKEMPPSENLFNDYSWGGYLIWKIPEKGRSLCF